MSRPTLVTAITLFVVTTTAAGTLPATDSALSNEAPLADAGLDQEVTKGATVLLDATGSRDPDGTVERYHWSIRTPNDETITSNCADCARTEFTPSEVGRYRVTLSVTDDDGATSSDTLYVDVSSGTEPAISLSGPQQPTEGSAATYTTDFDAGTAALAYVVWTVDGTEIGNHTLSADQDSDTATKRFPTAGERTISATVYDVDGQSSTALLSVAVQRDTKSPETPDSSLADRNSPTVTGDAVITGAEPLRGDYGIQLDASTSQVASVVWQNAAGPIASGQSLTRTWEPGDHELYAVVTYDDESKNVATFADGTTTVVADPKPNVSFGTLDRYGAISGSAIGLDEYGNLDDFRVEVDGETVATARSTVRGRNRLDADRQKMVHFSFRDFTPGEPTSVTLVATDERGQTTKVSREVVPVKEPEIVRSEFVNGPVDSYHERLDPSRYAAHHVLEIDLNGVDRENISVGVEGENGKMKKLDSDEYRIRKTSKTGKNIVKIDSFWAGKHPGVFEVGYVYKVEKGLSKWMADGKDTFKVTPSKPELRLDVLNDGTEDYVTREHGILVDASESFDPDGTNLKYIWKYGAEPTKPDNTTAKFGAYERAASIIENGHELRTKRNFDFLSYFVPDIQEKTVLTDDPYFPNETVRVRVETTAYHFSKQTYYDDFALGLSVSNSEAEVLKWGQIPAPDSRHSEPTEDAYRYAAIVELPASELGSGSEAPTITVYNEDNERKTAKVDFPDVNVLLKDGDYWTNTTVRNLTYTVEKPDVQQVIANSNETRDEYLENGYSVDTRRWETEYLLEKRVKVQDAEYETVTKDFASKIIRNAFLGSQSDWYRSGTFQDEVTRTKTTTEWHDATTAKSKSAWHDSDFSNGEYTGRSRQIVVEPAIYQTEKQYRYDYEVQKTGTRTITRTRTVRIPRTGTQTITECTIQFGCHTRTETYTYYTTETQTYTITRTYTYTVTRTETYWAASKFDDTHEPTGKTRRVKIKDATYETQYEIEERVEYTETVTRYEVSRDKLVQPAQYEWRAADSTNDSMLAHRQAASNDDWRIGETVTNTTWTLTKQNGTVRFKVSQYANESRVVETSATVVGDRVERYYNVETGEKVTKAVKEQSKRYTSDGPKDRQEMIAEVTSSEEKNDDCKLKGIC